jgi:hypothetical protein
MQQLLLAARIEHKQQWSTRISFACNPLKTNRPITLASEKEGTMLEEKNAAACIPV